LKTSKLRTFKHLSNFKQYVYNTLFLDAYNFEDIEDIVMKFG